MGALLATLVLAIGWHTGPAAAQEPPFNMSARANVDFAGDRFGDVWGDGNFLYGAHWGQPKIHILDISDPDNPVVASEYFLPPPNDNASAQDIKTGNDLCFIGLESDPDDSVHILDVRDPYNPRFIANVHIAGFDRVHDVFYDAGTRFLYICNSRNSHIAIVDLTGLSASSPQQPDITTARWDLDLTAPRAFVHDITIQNDRLYAANWDGGVWIFDVTDVANQQPSLLGQSSGGNNVHSVWATDDGQFMVVAEERTRGGITLFEIVPNGGGVDIVLRDQLRLAGGRAITAHNPLIVGNRVYVSWYQSGVQVYHINRMTKKFVHVASYDTSTNFGDGGFGGCWGVYPMLGTDRILASDIASGYWVLNAPLLDMVVSAGDTVVQGALGGPFDPPSRTVTMHNVGTASYDYEVASDVAWLSLDNGGGPQQAPLNGTLAPDESVDITILLSSGAAALGLGSHAGTVTFTNLTTGSGTTTRLMDVAVQDRRTLPMRDEFPTSAFEGTIWTQVLGGTIDTGGLNEPSPSRSARFRARNAGPAEIRTAFFDLSGLSNVLLRYRWERRGAGGSPERGDDLLVEYLDAAMAWQPLAQHAGSGLDMATYDANSVILPGGAYHDAFRLRFRVPVDNGASDDWFVDDVALSRLAPVADNENVCVYAGLVRRIALTADDPDGDPLDFVIDTLPALGTLSDPQSGSITQVPHVLVGGGNVVEYLADANADGPDAFDFHVDDGANGSNAARVSVGVVGCSRAPTLAVPDAGIYIVDGANSLNGHLLYIDNMNNLFDIGNMTFTSAQGLAFDRNHNVLYATHTSNRHLYRTSLADGAVVDVGIMGFDRIRGLAFDPNTDTLYGSDTLVDRLVLIDPACGAGRPVGTFGGALNIEGLAFDPISNTLYGSTTTMLYSIDTATGAATSIGAFGGNFDDVRGLAFDAGRNVLLGVQNDGADGQLLEIDVSTGTATSLGSHTDLGPLGLAFVPGTPLGIQGQPYAAAVRISGGCPDFVVVQTGGMLPGGLTLAADGTISGSPTESGTFAIDVEVTDSENTVAPGTVELIIDPPLKGDMNCDGVFNGGDIDPFFLALGDPAGHQTTFPGCDLLNGDMNNDGRVNGGDIDPFFACLGGGACP